MRSADNDVDDESRIGAFFQILGFTDDAALRGQGEGQPARGLWETQCLDSVARCVMS